MNINVLIPIAQGTEEMEAVIPIDLFRRAEINVVIAGDSYIVECSRGLKIYPDIKFDKLSIEQEYNAIVLPGGMGAVEILSNHQVLIEMIRKHNQFKKIIGAICAAPLILAKNDLIPANAKITSHPSIKDKFINYNYVEEKVVTFKNIITSRGAGTAFEFSLAIIEQLKGKILAQKIAKSIVFDYYTKIRKK